MDSDDWNDLGDAALWSSEPGWAGLIVAVVLAVICFLIAASERKTEEQDCADRCVPKAQQMIRLDDHRECRCVWEDGSLHIPSPSPSEMIGP